MPDQPPKQTSQQRASFARAERLRREADLSRPGKPRPRSATKSRPAAAKPSVPKSPNKQDRTAELLALAKKRIVAALENKEILLKEMQRRRLVRKGMEVRSAFTRAADRRRDEPKRAAHTQRQGEIKKGSQRKEDWKKQQERKAHDQRRENIRKEFTRKAADRRQQALNRAEQQRLAQLKEVERKAAAAIEAKHKRQREDQQRAHQRETGQIRNRHRREMDSLVSNEIRAVERHAGAIGRLDKAEQRDLSDLVARQQSLTGRIAGLKPGSSAERERAVQAVRDRYESDRLKTHRDLEALKERQFQLAQTTRLQNAKERLAAMNAHRDGRDQLNDRQEKDRPRLVEQRQHSMVREREHGQERAQAQERPQAPADGNRPTSAFSRVR